MRRELKRDRAPAPFHDTAQGATFALFPRLPVNDSDTPPRASLPGARWFEALDPQAAPPPPHRPGRSSAAPLFVAALLTLVLIQSLVLRTMISLAIGTAAGVVF